MGLVKATLVSATLLLLAACDAKAPALPRDLLLITIDTLRADYVPAFGHIRPIAPELDGFFEGSVCFERHYSTSPMTGPSHASLFTGTHPRQHGLRKNGHVLSSQVTTLAEVLEEAGFVCLAVVGSRVLESRFGLERGFQEYDDRMPEPLPGSAILPWQVERRAAEVADLALAQIAQAPVETPLFVWAHFFDPHSPYAAPEEFKRATELPRNLPQKIEASPFHSTGKLLELARDYEKEVAYALTEVARLIEGFDRRRGPAKNVIAFTADHGEGLGEHGLLGHGLYLYEELVRVPLAVRATGAWPGGIRISEVTSAVDVATSLLGLLAVPWPLAGFPGANLAALVDASAERVGDKPKETEARMAIAERPTYTEFDHQLKAEHMRLLEAKAGGPGGGRQDQVAFIEQRYKWIWDEQIGSELYDLSIDAAEAVDLCAKEQAQVTRLGERRSAWLDALGTQSVSQELVDEQTKAMLEALGY